MPALRRVEIIGLGCQRVIGVTSKVKSMAKETTRRRCLGTNGADRKRHVMTWVAVANQIGLVLMGKVGAFEILFVFAKIMFFTFLYMFHSLSHYGCRSSEYSPRSDIIDLILTR